MNLQTFSIKLKELRHNLNLTQREFVKELSITPATLSAYEKGLSNPSISAITEIATKYKVSVDWLLGLSDNSTTTELRTYSDVLENIFQLATSPIDIEFNIKEIKTGDVNYKTDIEIYIQDHTLAFILDKFNKTYVLYKNNTLDIDVLQAVVDSLKKEYKNNEIGF